MISSSLLVAAIVVAVIVVAAAVAALLIVRARSRGRGQAALPGGPSGSGGFTCPFCKRPYDPAQTGGRCPSCGAAAPRR